MCSIKLCKQTNTVLHSPVRPKQMLQQSGQETKASKTEAWGSRQYGAYSAHASLLSCARPPRDHPGGLPPPRRFCWESDSRTGTFPRADGIWAVGWLAFFPLSEPSDTGWEASHSKLHTRLKAELNCTAFMKHCRGKKINSITFQAIVHGLIHKTFTTARLGNYVSKLQLCLVFPNVLYSQT